MNIEIIKEEPLGDRQPHPVLFVHGMWHAAWCWAEHFLPYFARRGYTAWAFSLRGHGSSEGRSRLRWTTLAEYVDDLAQVVAQMENRPVLVGHSMGGLIVQKYLESHSAPAAVLLASAPPSGLIPGTLRIAARHPLAFLKANATISMFPVIGTTELAREAFFSADMPEELVNAYFTRLQDESYRAYLDLLGLNLPRPTRIHTPILVLGAVDDRLISQSEVRSTARAYNTEARLFPAMAHDMMLDTNWQAVADCIFDWLIAQAIEVA